MDRDAFWEIIYSIHQKEHRKPEVKRIARQLKRAELEAVAGIAWRSRMLSYLSRLTAFLSNLINPIPDCVDRIGRAFFLLPGTRRARSVG